MTTDRNELLALLAELNQYGEHRVHARGPQEVLAKIRAIAAQPSGEVTDDFIGRLYGESALGNPGWELLRKAADTLQSIIPDCPKCAGYKEDAERLSEILLTVDAWRNGPNFISADAGMLLISELFNEHDTARKEP